MPEPLCKCGLPERNHSSYRHSPAGLGQIYKNEASHWVKCEMRWYQPHHPWVLGGLRRLCNPLVDKDGPEKMRLDSAHLLCNKDCPVYTLVGDSRGPGLFFEYAYAAWFHHALVDTTRCRFLVERIDCSGMDELYGLKCPQDLNRQTTNLIRALKQIHQALCQLAVARAKTVTAEDIANSREPEEGTDEFQYGRIYVDEYDSFVLDSIMTFDHHRLRAEFDFLDSFRRYFVFIDEEHLDSKGVTLVDLEGPPILGKGWQHDTASDAYWLRDKPGNVLELFLKLLGRRPTDMPDVMHGRRSINEPPV